MVVTRDCRRATPWDRDSPTAFAPTQRGMGRGRAPIQISCGTMTPMIGNEECGTRVQRIGAYGVCVSESNQMLLSRFSAPDLRWVLPGGGVEHGEHPADAVVREVSEETGYEVAVRRLMSVESGTWRAPDSTEFHAVNILYEVEVVGGVLTNEVDGGSDLAAWFPVDEVLTLHRSEIVDVALARRDAEEWLRS